MEVVGLLIVLVLAVVVMPLTIFLLHKFFTKTVKEEDKTLGHKVMLVNLVNAIVDRDVEFHKQRQTVYEMALEYKQEIEKESKITVKKGVIRLFDPRLVDHRNSEDKKSKT